MERVKKKYKSITRSDWDKSTYHSLNAYSKKQTWRTLEQICAEEFESWMFERICASTEHWVQSTAYWALSTEYWVLSTEHWVLSTEYSVSILISWAWIVLFMQTAATWTWKRKLIDLFSFVEIGRVNLCLKVQILPVPGVYVREGAKIWFTWESIQVLSGAFRDRGKAGGVAPQPPTGGN